MLTQERTATRKVVIRIDGIEEDAREIFDLGRYDDESAGLRLATFERPGRGTTYSVHPDDFIVDWRNGEPRWTKRIANAVRDEKAYVLSCYRHSDVSWHLKGSQPVCRFDTAVYAGLLFVRGRMEKLERRDFVVKFLKTYSDWCNGRLHEISIIDADDFERDADLAEPSDGWYASPDEMDEFLNARLGSIEVVAVAGEFSSAFSELVGRTFGGERCTENRC